MSWIEILITLAITVVGIVIALLIDRSRLPKIEIIVAEQANDDVTYQQGPNAGQRWKYFRVFAQNKKMPLLFQWLVRQTAENCRATITILGVNNNTNFTYKGRWASTPELPYYRESAIVKIFDPDPVMILAGERETLDIIAKNQGDNNAYAWNNEAYFYGWKTPHYRLNPGQYNVKVTITTQNGISSTKIFTLTVANTIEETSFIL